MGLSTFTDGKPVEQLRGLAFLALSDTATILQRISTSDAGGGAYWAGSAIGTAPCRIYPAVLRARPGEAGGRLNENTTHRATLPAGTDISTENRLAMNGGTFEVTMLLDRTSSPVVELEVFKVD